jgi:hypothetical protein
MYALILSDEGLVLKPVFDNLRLIFYGIVFFLVMYVVVSLVGKVGILLYKFFRKYV